MDSTARTLRVGALVLVVVAGTVFLVDGVLLALPPLRPGIAPLLAVIWLLFVVVITAASRIGRPAAVLGAGAVLAVAAGLDLAGADWLVGITAPDGAVSPVLLIAVAVVLTNGAWTRWRTGGTT